MGRPDGTVRIQREQGEMDMLTVLSTAYHTSLSKTESYTQG